MPPSRSKLLTICLASAACLAAPAAAQAATLSYEGDTLVFRAAPGETNFLSLAGDDTDRGRVGFSEEISSYPVDRCSRRAESHPLFCEIVAHTRIELGDGNDIFGYGADFPGGTTVTVLAGDGDDRIESEPSPAGPTTLDGGAGNDQIKSYEGGDRLLGGEGDDTLEAREGDDELRGGPGDDSLEPDAAGKPRGADIVDGGPGADLVKTSWSTSGAVSITLDGVANDGEPGEGDNVLSMDSLVSYSPGTFVMSDEPEEVSVWATEQPSTIDGRGGDDRLTSGNGQQTIHGGAGNDRVEGGFGNDTLTGGPGQDAIHGDMTGSQCGIGQSCTLPHGNDTIDARDGEADTVDCGPGTDTAKVDAIDTVSECETVEGGAAKRPERDCGCAKKPGDKKADDTTRPDVAGARLEVAPRKLRAALRRGLAVRLSGLPEGVATVRVLRGRKLVGSARVKVAADGTAAATVKFTRRARRTLARKRSVRLTVAAGAARTAVTLKR